MRRFLRRLRKGLKTACLTVALATCWQVGQVAKADISPPNWGDEVTIKFSGTVSPATNDLSHLFLLYGTGYSIVEYGFWAIKLGDFPAGQETHFSVLETAIYHESLFWYTAGLYGDISSGLYEEGVNGVNLGIDADEGVQWDLYFSTDISEQDVFDYLFNDAPENVTSNLWGSYLHVEYVSGLEITDSSILFDFSEASNNGLIQIQSEIVPEPLSIVFFGGGMIVVYLRRRNK